MASGSPEIIPAGSITFAGFVDGKRQYLRSGGVSNVRAGVLGTEAVVGVRSQLTRITWQFERNTRHWFVVMKNGEFLTDLEFQTPSGVMVLGGPGESQPDPFYTFDQGDTIQMYCYHDYWENRFVGPFSDKMTFTLKPSACKSISIRPVSDFPQVIGTSRHITQGLCDLNEEAWDRKSGAL